MTKRWRYRKVTPQMVEEMKILRTRGYTYTKIGEKFNLSPRTAKYWIDEEYRKKCIAKVKAQKKKRVLTPEQKARQRAYIRKYINDRYHSDPEFRNRFLKHSKKWQEKNRERLKKEREDEKEND